MLRCAGRRREFVRIISSTRPNWTCFSAVEKNTTSRGTPNWAPFGLLQQQHQHGVCQARYFSTKEENAAVIPPIQPNAPAETASQGTEPSQLVLRRLLDHKKLPLGTFDWADWEAGMLEFTRRLEQLLLTTLANSSNAAKYSASGVQSNLAKGSAMTCLGIGKQVLEADEMLQRLTMEAATNSFVARSVLQPLDLCAMSMTILGSWIEVHAAFPKTPIPLGFARSRLQWIHDELRRLRSQGIELDEDQYKPLYKSFINLIHGFMNLETANGADQAVELLTVPETTELFQNCPEHIIPVFHEVLLQLLSRVGAENSASALLNYMEHVAQTMPSWEAIRPKHLQLAVHHGDSSVPQNDGNTLIDPAEAQALLQKLIARIDITTERDDALAAKAVAILEVLESKTSPMASFLALAEYYVRIGDVANATVWIGRLEAEEIASFDQRVSECLGKAIVLWIKERAEDASAIYRAEEILGLLEKVSKLNGTATDQRLYMVLGKVWLLSDTVWGTEKGINVVMRSDLPSLDLLDFALKAFRKNDSKNQVDMVLKLHRWYVDLLESMSPEQVNEYGGKLVSLLLDVAQKDEALRVFESIVDRGVSLSPDAFESLYACLKQPQECAYLLNKLKSLGTALDPKIALIVVKLIQVDQFGGHLQILSSILSPDIFSSGADKEILSALVSAVVEKLLTWNDPKRALDFIEMVEGVFPDKGNAAIVPMTCYQHLIIAFVRNDAGGGVAKKLLRQLQMRESAPYPDSDFCEQYLYTVRGSASWVLSECSDVLRRLVEIYKSTQDNKFKPKATMYTKILNLLYSEREKQVAIASKAQDLISEMVELKAHDGDTRPFHQALQIACKCERGESYDLGLALYQKMLSTDGVDVDAAAFCKFLWTCMGYRNVAAKRPQLQTALEYFGHARREGMVNNRTYAVAFQLIARLAQVQMKDQLIDRMFQMCCLDGYLSNRLRSEVQQMVSEESWDRIYRSRLAGQNREPDSWSRNVEWPNQDNQSDSQSERQRAF